MRWESHRRIIARRYSSVLIELIVASRNSEV